MQGDFSLSIAGTAPDTDAVKTAIASFLASLTANGVTISSGAYTASESIETLIADAGAGQ